MDDKILSVSTTELTALMEGMDASLQEANSLVEQMHIESRAELAEVDYRQLKNMVQILSAAYERTEEARKSFKRAWQEPLNRVETAFKNETEAIKSLHELYKAELKSRDDAEREEKRAHLQGVYVDFCEANGFLSLIDNVPFERIIEGEKWLNRSESVTKCEQKLIDKVSGIMSDWRSVQATPYRFPEEAVRCFFRTLSLREVNENDARLGREEDARKALEDEIRANREAMEQEYPQPENPVADSATEAPEDVFDVPFEQVLCYVFTLEITQRQAGELMQWLQMKGIHGSFKVTR